MKLLSMRDHQRAVSFDSRAMRRRMLWLLDDYFVWPHYEIGVHFVSVKKMAILNFEHLQHVGPTDILTFNYSKKLRQGELFICPKVASDNANQHGIMLKQELTRYLVHGLLHMIGYDDKKPVDQKNMKREENRILKILPDG